MFINSAIAKEVAAATAPAVSEGNGMRVLLQLAIIFVIFYIFLIRPQQKRMKAHEKMLNDIEKGATVIVGGIEGTVSKVLNDRELIVKIADGVEVKVLRGYISQVVSEMDILDEKPQPKKK